MEKNNGIKFIKRWIYAPCGYPLFWFNLFVNEELRWTESTLQIDFTNCPHQRIKLLHSTLEKLSTPRRHLDKIAFQLFHEIAQIPEYREQFKTKDYNPEHYRMLQRIELARKAKEEKPCFEILDYDVFKPYSRFENREKFDYVASYYKNPASKQQEVYTLTRKQYEDILTLSCNHELQAAYVEVFSLDKTIQYLHLFDNKVEGYIMIRDDELLYFFYSTLNKYD
ncbi:MAG: hypothetical protein ACJ77K_19215 [Bacteroidia bacterium]